MVEQDNSTPQKNSRKFFLVNSPKFLVNSPTEFGQLIPNILVNSLKYVNSPPKMVNSPKCFLQTSYNICLFINQLQFESMGESDQSLKNQLTSIFLGLLTQIVGQLTQKCWSTRPKKFGHLAPINCQLTRTF